MNGAVAAGVYLHFPFCAVKCAYCDFAVAAGQDHKIPRYLLALVREMDLGQFDGVPRADTVYLGGGTPSRMAGAEISSLIRAVRDRVDVPTGAEISLEANPEDVVPTAVEGWLRAGIDRLSIGVQSLDADVLRASGRAYDGAGALHALRVARGAGLRSVGVDLIAGLPGERLALWPDTIARVLDARPDHVSMYLLETDHESALGKAMRRGRIAEPDEDAQVEAYLRSSELLCAAGLPPYEISNFARPGHDSRHNTKYWTDEPFAAFGVGAHAYLGGHRRGNVRGLDRYVSEVEAGRDPVAERDPWDRARRAEEAVMLGLRRAAGVDLQAVGARYGFDPHATYGVLWPPFVERGWLELEGPRVRLTAEGRVRSNAVFREILGRPLRPGPDALGGERESRPDRRSA